MRFTAFVPKGLWAGALLVPALGGFLACHGAGSPRAGAGARLWIDGPVRWLMLPAEVKEFRSLRSPEEAAGFVEEFWRRRDPTPGDGDNPVRQTFLERSEAADRLFGEAGRKGSLTDRGRALILLGPPSVLRYRQVPVPVLEPDRRRRGGEARKRWMTQEIWAYAPESLPPSFLALLPEEAREGEIALVFVAESSRTYLLEGERFCQLAAQAVVLSVPPS